MVKLSTKARQKSNGHLNDKFSSLFRHFLAILQKPNKQKFHNLIFYRITNQQK